MYADTFVISPEQRTNILEYIDLTNDIKNMPTKDTPHEEFREKTIEYLNILEAFGNDPKRAAKYKNEAIEKAENAMDEVYERRLAHIRKPTDVHFYEHFKTKKQAEDYKQSVIDEAGKAFSNTLKKEFYAIYSAFRFKTKPKIVH